MSWYYTYYVGFVRDGKIYPLGPYDAEGKLCPVISRSRSFASDLHYQFYDISEEMVSKEFKNEFLRNAEDDEEEELKYLAYLSYLPINDLPKGDYIKRGYFLVEDVERYEEDSEDFPYMTPPISPVVYAKKMENELKFGPKDDYGDEYCEPNASDYTYYAYPDYGSKEYEAKKIRDVAGMLSNFYRIDFYENEHNVKLVAILKQG